MVCVVCRNMLGCQDGRYAKGALDIRYDHHKNARTFQQAVQQNCYICRALYISLLDHLKHNASQPRRESIISSSHTTDERDCFSDLAQQSLSSRASLFLQKLDHTYRLKIHLKRDQISVQHTFHLECRQGSHGCPDQRSIHVKYRTLGGDLAISHDLSPSSLHRDSETVHQWLKVCKCYTAPPEPFYPTRLLSLENVKASDATSGTSPASRRGSRVTVNLVETAAWSRTGFGGPSFGGSNKHYVTLSHCWGGIVSHRLLRSNYEDYKRGVPVDDLPKTFQDAVYFAASLDQVGYIWIDSLCIIQEDAVDWLEESAKMDRVYSETFLNLSATAALDSHGGLFKRGDFELLQEEEVVLDIEGLPLAYDRNSVPKCPHERSCFFLRYCTIADASFWSNKVDNGPVNTRGWVLQERLMSPRVLHFCHDQVGWECACHNISQTATSDKKQISNTTGNDSRYHDIIAGIQRRMLDANDGTDGVCPTTYSPIDLWDAVVNAYTKTTVSFSKDKLVALSGLAKIIFKETKCAYVAGLWRTHLASQLLWYIEPAFDHRDRSFSNPATFGATYRAPSFSWAAIDVTSHGITYAKVAKQKLFVTIEDTLVDTLSGNAFGVVSNARITLRGKLRKARLVSIPNNRFAWYLVDRGDLDAEPHRNVYLDCPLRDTDCIDNPDAHVYVLPVAEEITYGGTTRNLYLICLILRAGGEKGTFKRVGMTKLSQFMDKKALTKLEVESGMAEYKILTAFSSDAMLPHASYDENTGMHRLHLV